MIWNSWCMNTPFTVFLRFICCSSFMRWSTDQWTVELVCVLGKVSAPIYSSYFSDCMENSHCSSLTYSLLILASESLQLFLIQKRSQGRITKAPWPDSFQPLQIFKTRSRYSRWVVFKKCLCTTQIGGKCSTILTTDVFAIFLQKTVILLSHSCVVHKQLKSDGSTHIFNWGKVVRSKSCFFV